MTNYDDVYGSRFLAATDLKAPVTVTIEKIDYEQFARPGELPRTKAVVYFKNASKPMVLNKTNASTLASAFGKNFANWVGKRATIKTEPTLFGGKKTLGLRLYPLNGPDRPAPAITSEPPPQGDDADVIPY
jgi:hypothetical protein